MVQKVVIQDVHKVIHVQQIVLEVLVLHVRKGTPALEPAPEAIHDQVQIPHYEIAQATRSQELYAKVTVQHRGMQVRKLHRVTTNRTDRVRHTTELRVEEVHREVTEHHLLQPNRVIVPVVLRRAAAEAVTAAVEVAVATEVVDRHIRVVQEVQAAPAEEAVVVQDHLRAGDN